MISSAVWCKYARINFSKTTKLHEPVVKTDDILKACARSLKFARVLQLCTRVT